MISLVLCFTVLFAQNSEDQLIIEGLYYSQKNPKEAAQKWKKLFEATNNEAYLLEYFYASLKYRKIQDVIRELKAILNKKKSKELYELLASLYANEGDTKGLIDLVGTMATKDISSMYEVAYLYAIDGNDTKALELYREIYKKDKSWDSLKGILSTLARLKRLPEAKKILWSELHKNSKLPKEAYIVLLGLINDHKEPQRAIFALKKLYKITKEPKYLKSLIGLYIYTKEYNQLIDLLEETHYDNKLLYELYLSKDEIEKAYKLIYAIYQKTKDPKWLGEEASLTYELANKYHAVDKRVIKRMGALFEKAFQAGVVNASYFNYYGYTLIDHNIDIKKGLEYVKKAVALEPKNIFYLDSLAWGYYKLKHCKEAKEIVKKIKKLSTKESLEDEILEHIKKIEKCKEQ